MNELEKQEETIDELGEQKELSALLDPVRTPAKALEAWVQYQDLKSKIGSEEDFATIQGKMHPKRQWVNKLTTFLNIKTEIIRSVQIENGVVIIDKGDVVQTSSVDDKDVVSYEYWVRATAPSGRFSENVGACEIAEKKKGRMAATKHNVAAHALTRARCRAVLDLVGFGEVSAEEILAPPEAEEIDYQRPVVTKQPKKSEQPEPAEPAQIQKIEYLLAEKELTIEQVAEMLSEKYGRTISDGVENYTAKQAEWLIKELSEVEC